MLELNKDNFQKEVLENNKPVLVDFFATWCGPCMMLGPIVESLEEELKEKIIIRKISVDEAPEIASKYNVRSIPTLILFKDGEIKQYETGFMPKEEIIRTFKLDQF